MEMKSWSRKSLLGLEDMNREEIICLLDKAKEFQKVLASRFEARCDAQKGITSKEFDFGGQFSFGKLGGRNHPKPIRASTNF